MLGLLRWQIALLVAGINYVLEVEATLDRVDAGDNSALTGYHDLQVSACQTDVAEPRVNINPDQIVAQFFSTFFHMLVPGRKARKTNKNIR